MITETVKRAQAGDQDAFAELYRQHKQQVYGICYQFTKQREDAEDLTQDVFLRVYSALHLFRGDSQFGTWLYRVARNIALMSLRRHRAERRYGEILEIENPSISACFARPDHALESACDRVVVQEALRDMPPGMSGMLALKFLEGYEHHEIASLLDCSVGNSKSQVHKAKEHLRERIEPRRPRFRRP